MRSSYRKPSEQKLSKEAQKALEEIGMREEDIIKKKREHEAMIKREKSRILKRMWQYSKLECCSLITAILACIVQGACTPVLSIFVGELMQVFPKSIPKDYNKDDFSYEVNMNCLGIFIICILNFIFSWISIYLLGTIAERTILRVRKEVFGKIVRLPIPWHDMPENDPGKLASVLAVDANKVKNLTSDSIALVIQGIASLICGIVIAFCYCWELTLCCIAVTPLLIICALVNQQRNRGFAEQTDASYKESSGIVMESITNIRTVFSFASEEYVLKV